MAYADGFVIPIPKKNIAAYRRMARKGCKIWLEYGALDYYECVGDDLAIPAPFDITRMAFGGFKVIVKA